MNVLDRPGREAAYLLDNHKRRLEDCAGALNSLASVFSMNSASESGLSGNDEGKNRETLIWVRRMEENSQLFSGHLKEMAGLLKQTAEESVRFIRPGKRKLKQMERMLRLDGLHLEDFYLLEKANGRQEAVARLSCSSRGARPCPRSAEEIAGYFSVLLELKLVPTGQCPFFAAKEAVTMYFQEESRYTVLTGFARAVKEGERLSGDNCRFVESAQKDFFALLSDGMGSGEKANKDSETVLDMLEKALSSGFTPAAAIQLINDALIVGGENKNMSTLDLCRLNLYTGEGELFKVGAAPTLIKSEANVSEIALDSLPLGVFSGLKAFPQRFTFSDGDYLFLLSDGITDSLSGPEAWAFFKEMIAHLPYRRPKEMANHLMNYVIQASGGRIRDDMTILAVGIWED